MKLNLTIILIVMCILGFSSYGFSQSTDSSSTDTTKLTSEDTSKKVDGILPLVYKGIIYGLGNVVDLSKKGRDWVGVGFFQKDAPNIYVGKEWVVKEFNFIGDDKGVMDFALGYAVAKINKETVSADSVVVNTDYKTALVTASLGWTWKPEIGIDKVFKIKDTGVSAWGGVDPNVNVDGGVQEHQNLTEVGGIKLNEDTWQAWAIKGAIIALSIYAGQ